MGVVGEVTPGGGQCAFTGVRMVDEPSEHKVQSALVSELRHRLHSHVVCMAIPNGGARHPIIGRKLKAEGLLPGSPDLVFALPNAATFWLEMKRLSGRLSDAQLGIHFRLTGLGHDVAVANSVSTALEMLGQRGLLR